MDKETVKKRLLESSPDALPKTPEGVIFGDRAAIDEFQKTGMPRRYKAWSESHYFYFDNHAATETVQRLAESDNIFMQFARTALAFFVSLADDEIDAAKECLKNNPDIFDALAAKIAPGQQMELFPQAEGVFTAAFCEELKRKTSGVIEVFIPTYAAAKKIQTGKPARMLPVCSKISDLSRLSEEETKGARVELDGRKKAVILFDIDNTALAENNRAFSLFDKQVHDAVCTLWGNEIFEFSAEQVYKAIHNLPGNAKIDGEHIEKRLDEIERSIDKSAIRRVCIDATEQYKIYFPGDTETSKAKITDYLLNIKKLERYSKMGNKRTVWAFVDAPAVYRYSTMYNQIATVNIHLLDTRKKLKNTKEVSLMRDYLSGEIEFMRGGKRSETILYSRLFEKCEIDESGLAQAQRNRKRTQIKKILEAFTENGYIAGYEETKKGRTYNGVKIILNGNARKGK